MERDTFQFRQVAPDEGQTYQIISDLVTFKARAADTGGAYVLLELRSTPQHGMPRHLQRYDDIAFLVLDGTYAFQVGQQTLELGAGGYISVPRQTVHGYTNVGASPAQLLILASPGSIFGQFLTEIGIRSATRKGHSQLARSEDLARMAMVAEKYGIEFPSPKSDGD